jgi:hypothetical protein
MDRPFPIDVDLRVAGELALLLRDTGTSDLNLRPFTSMKIKDYLIPHPAGLAAEVAAIRARTRHVTARSFELLSLAKPDTFLGRQHYPLFPLPYEEEERPDEAVE